MSNQERWAWNTIGAFCAAFAIHSSIFLKHRQTDAYTHTHTNPFHALLIYKRPYFWVSPIPIISSSALSVLHPAASNQKPDLSASHVWLQHKWMSASFSTVCLGVPRGWNWDLNMLRRFFPPTWGVYKGAIFTSPLYSSPSATHAIPILIRLKMLQNVLHNRSLTLTV